MNSKFKKFIIGIIAVSASFSLYAENCSPSSKSCLFGVFPHTNFQQLMTTYRGITEDLSLILDTNVKLRSSSSMQAFENFLKANLYDIALIGGGQFISTGLKAGYIPLVSREGSLKFSLYVLNNSEITNYKNLQGKTLGIMLKGTTTNFVTHKLFEKHHISMRDIDLVPLDTQQGCAHAIVVGKVDACVFGASILEIIEQQNISVKFRSVGESLDILKPIFAVSSSLSPDIRSEVKTYLLGRGDYQAVTPEYIQQMKKDLLPSH